MYQSQDCVITNDQKIIKASNFSIEKNIFHLGSTFIFNTPDKLVLAKPIDLSINNTLIFRGILESQTFSATPKERSYVYGARDALTSRLDTASPSFELAPGSTCLQAAKKIVRKIDSKISVVDYSSAKLSTPFRCEETDLANEALNNLAQTCGLFVFSDGSDLVFRRKPIESSFIIDDSFKILAISLEENISNGFSLVFKDKEEGKVIWQQKSNGLRKEKIIHCADGDLHKSKFYELSQKISSYQLQIEFFGYLVVDLFSTVKVNISSLGLSGDFVITGCTIKEDKAAKKTIFSLTKKEFFLS